MRGDPMSEKEGASSSVIKLMDIVALDAFDGGREVVSSISKKK